MAQYCFETSDQTPDPFGSGLGLQSTVGDTDVASRLRACPGILGGTLIHPEGCSGDDRDAVFADESFRKIHRIQRRMDAQQKIKSAIGTGHRAEFTYLPQ